MKFKLKAALISSSVVVLVIIIVVIVLVSKNSDSTENKENNNDISGDSNGVDNDGEESIAEENGEESSNGTNEEIEVPFSEFKLTAASDSYVLIDNRQYNLADNITYYIYKSINDTTEVPAENVLFTYIASNSNSIAILKNDFDLFDEDGTYIFVSANSLNNIVTTTSSDTLDLASLPSNWTQLSTGYVYDYTFQFTDIE